MTKKKKKTKKKLAASKKPEKISVGANIADVTPYPSAGKKNNDFEIEADRQIAGGIEQPKRGPGRPRKEPPAAEPEQFDSPVELVTGAIKMPFELWSISQNLKFLALTDKEAKQLAEPVKALLDYYLPRIPAIAYAWMSLSVTTFWIFRPRLMKIAEIKKQAAPSPPEAAVGPVSVERHGGPPPANNPQKFPTMQDIKNPNV